MCSRECHCNHRRKVRLEFYGIHVASSVTATGICSIFSKVSSHCVRYTHKGNSYAAHLVGLGLPFSSTDGLESDWLDKQALGDVFWLRGRLGTCTLPEKAEGVLRCSNMAGSQGILTVRSARLALFQLSGIHGKSKSSNPKSAALFMFASACEPCRDRKLPRLRLLSACVVTLMDLQNEQPRRNGRIGLHCLICSIQQKEPCRTRRIQRSPFLCSTNTCRTIAITHLRAGSGLVVFKVIHIKKECDRTLTYEWTRL